jgi:hypothetical protein
MSAPVDVLAALSDAGQLMERDGYADFSYDLALAHVAVAELIEAATAARDHVRPTCTELFERLDAAIARCEGGAA